MRETMFLSLWRDRRGVAALEFGVVSLLLITLMLGAYDLGNMIQQRVRLQSAVRAGAQYAQFFPTDFSGIAATTTAALDGWSNVTVPTPTMSCSCNGAGANCGDTCATGMRRTVTVSASRPFSPLLLTTISTVSANALARVE